MFYSNVKKSLDLPSSPFGFIKNFIKGDKERCRQNGTSGESLDFSRGSPGRLSLPRKSESPREASVVGASVTITDSGILYGYNGKINKFMIVYSMLYNL